MPYHLKRKESVADGIRRIASETLQGALQDLRAHRPDVAHAARKRLKMSRAILRLARPGLDAADFDRENIALRDIGLLLSPLRDADVFVSVMHTLEPLDPRHLGFPNISGIAHTGQREARRRILEAGTIAEARTRLQTVEERVDAWAGTSLHGSTLVKGLRASYRKAQRSREAAERSRRDDRWHEWRKRVKDLWYHLRVLRLVWPAVLDSTIDELDRLDKSLGEDHDMAMLGGHLRTLGRSPEMADEISRLKPLVRRRRQELQQQAREQAQILLEAKPRVFARQFEACWDAWRA